MTRTGKEREGGRMPLRKRSGKRRKKREGSTLPPIAACRRTYVQQGSGEKSREESSGGCFNFLVFLLRAVRTGGRDWPLKNLCCQTQKPVSVLK